MRRWEKHENRAEILDERYRRLIFRDDDRDGFCLSVLRAPDGDFHVSIAVVNEDADEFERQQYGAMWCKSIRVRMPMIGGGSHPELYQALVQLFESVPVTR